ncbi:MAG TPA: hypothetical protein VKA80_09645, partial [Beijerinckiaceae bacterium]|nr:hypothetical protein [Beijerinckiaceae bacterium]
MRRLCAFDSAISRASNAWRAPSSSAEAQRLRGDRLHGRERVLHSMVQLVHEERAVVLGLTPLRDLALRRL